MLHKKTKDVVGENIADNIEALCFSAIESVGDRDTHKAFSEYLFHIAQYNQTKDVTLPSKKGTVVIHSSRNHRVDKSLVNLLDEELDRELNAIIAETIVSAGEKAAMYLLADIVFFLSTAINIKEVELDNKKGSLYILN